MKLAQKIAINYIRAKLNILAVLSKRKAAKKAFDIFCTPFVRSKKKAPTIFAKGEKLTFKLDNKSVKGYRWNQGAGRKILICHGFESTCFNFDRYISLLVKNNFEVLAFDAPAHGRSDGKRIQVPMYVDMLRRIDQYFGPVDAFLGHSFGGLAISHYLETLPSTKEIAAVLIAPATETVSSINTFFRVLQLDEAVRKEFDKVIFEKGGEWPSYFSIRRAIRSMKGPVLWIHDEDDDLTPLADALKVRDDQHPNVEFMITQGLGHRRIYRENKVVKQAIDFLSKSVR